CPRFSSLQLAAPATEVYTLPLHDALPISAPTWHLALMLAVATLPAVGVFLALGAAPAGSPAAGRPAADLPRIDLAAGQRAAWSRSEEHTSELQSRENLVCRLLLEKKKHTV